MLSFSCVFGDVYFWVLFLIIYICCVPLSPVTETVFSTVQHCCSTPVIQLRNTDASLMNSACSGYLNNFMLFEVFCHLLFLS